MSPGFLFRCFRRLWFPSPGFLSLCLRNPVPFSVHHIQENHKPCSDCQPHNHPEKIIRMEADACKGRLALFPDYLRLIGNPGIAKAENIF